MANAGTAKGPVPESFQRAAEAAFKQAYKNRAQRNTRARKTLDG